VSRPPAFILGLEVNGYGVVRSLARAGVRVVGFHSCARDELGRFSRYCESHYLPPSLSEDEICQSLIDHGRRTGGKPVLFVASDYYAFILARYREELSKHFRYHWVDAERLQRIVDKAQVSAVCRQADVLIPRTHATRPEEDPAQTVEQLSFPCLIKPNRSFHSTFPPGLKNYVAGSPEAFVAFYQAHPELKGTTVCQEIIAGGDDHMFEWIALVRGSGEPGAEFCARKLRQYLPGYGVMCFGRSEENELLARQGSQLLRSLDYRGLASLEFKYRAEDGRFYFIEMNPRLSRFSALFADAGVNFPYLAYLDLTASQRSEPIRARQRNGVHWISFADDLSWFRRTRREGGLGLLSWLRSVARARSYAWFDWRDPIPFLRAGADFLSTSLRRAFRPSSP
jgi:D-aspartate ligase